MDPRIYSEESGLPSDSSKSEDRVNRLRRQKGSVTEGSSAGAVRGDGKNGAATAGPQFKDRRQSPRLRCSGSVEFRAQGSDVCMWGTLTDVSLHGCYVEMNATFPVGTKVGLVLKSFGIQIHTSGTVRATYPFLGMGISFAEMEPLEHLQLRQLLDALSGRETVSPVRPEEDTGTKDILGSGSPKALIEEIADFFQKKQLLSRAEFYQIAKRVRRS